MPTQSDETVEDHIPLPAFENAVLDKKFVAGPRTFDGKTLAPYGLAVEGLMDEALVGIKSDALFALTMLQLLVDLHGNFERYGKEGWDGAKAPALRGDTATDAAAADVLKAVHGDVTLYQARAIRWRTKLGRKGVEAAIKLANEIVQESKDTEVVSGEENHAPGK